MVRTTSDKQTSGTFQGQFKAFKDKDLFNKSELFNSFLNIYY